MTIPAGPWTFAIGEFNRTHSIDGTLGSIKSADGYYLAEVWQDYENGESPFPQGTALQVAQIMTAAPDLLAALKAVLRGYDGPTVDIGTSISSHIAAARAAVAKAEGAQ